MNAIELLKTQHKEVKSLLEQLVESSGQEGKKLLDEITKNLLGHMIIEQEIFYPAVAQADLPDVDEGYEEHHVAREAIKRAMLTKNDKVLFQARAKVLKELIEHHADEEEKEMFPKVEKALGDEKIDALGARMKPRFEQLKTLGLIALARRVEEVDVLADAKNGGRKTRVPARRGTAKKKARTARATRSRAPRSQKKARR